MKTRLGFGPLKGPDLLAGTGSGVAQDGVAPALNWGPWIEGEQGIDGYRTSNELYDQNVGSSSFALARSRVYDYGAGFDDPNGFPPQDDGFFGHEFFHYGQPSSGYAGIDFNDVPQSSGWNNGDMTLFAVPFPAASTLDPYVILRANKPPGALDVEIDPTTELVANGARGKLVTTFDFTIPVWHDIVGTHSFGDYSETYRQVATGPDRYQVYARDHTPQTLTGAFPEPSYRETTAGGRVCYRSAPWEPCRQGALAGGLLGEIGMRKGVGADSLEFDVPQAGYTRFGRRHLSVAIFASPDDDSPFVPLPDDQLRRTQSGNTPNSVVRKQTYIEPTFGDEYTLEPRFSITVALRYILPRHRWLYG